MQTESVWPYQQAHGKFLPGQTEILTLGRATGHSLPFPSPSPKAIAAATAPWSQRPQFSELAPSSVSWPSDWGLCSQGSLSPELQLLRPGWPGGLRGLSAAPPPHVATAAGSTRLMPLWDRSTLRHSCMHSSVAVSTHCCPTSRPCPVLFSSGTPQTVPIRHELPSPSCPSPWLLPFLLSVSTNLTS